MFSEPNEHHQWLERFIGDWTFVHRCDAGPDHEAMETTGTETVRAFSDLWIVADGQGEIPGTPDTMRMRLTLGYDPNTERYIGSWIGSPMAQMFVYSGTREGDTLTLDTEGPSFEDPAKIVPYQDIYTIVDDNTRTLRSQAKDDRGNWVVFMNAEYTRTS